RRHRKVYGFRGRTSLNRLSRFGNHQLPWASDPLMRPAGSRVAGPMRSIPAAWRQVLDFFGTPLVLEPSPGQLSSDAGLLPIRQFDRRVRLSRAHACALEEPRDPDLTEHTFRRDGPVPRLRHPRRLRGPERPRQPPPRADAFAQGRPPAQT